MQIRAATPDDAVVVGRIVAEAYAPYLPRIGREPAPMAVDYRLLIETTDQVWVVADAHDTPVGVVVTVIGSDHVQVDNVAVARSAQGRGLGRQLLEYAEGQARERGLLQIRLYTNAAMTENLAIYPRLGYVEVDRRTEDGFDRVYFRKNLCS